MKRIVALADLHSGHKAGLTPPGWWWPIRSVNEDRNRWGRVQRELWGHYEDIRESVGQVDILLANGDLVDGRGVTTGGTELVTASVLEQRDMAIESLKIWEAKKVICAYGTSFHTGKLEDYERDIARGLGGEIHSEPFIESEGVTFNMKHHIGRSVVPYGRGTAIARDRLWNLLWAERGEQPKADVVLRAHVHYFSYIGGANWLAMILPALQAAKTKYGARRCSGTVDWGLVVFDVEGGEFDWTAHLVDVEANKTEVIRA